ncbi:MAG: SRPBCC family protein [Caldilineaceae bacterium]
MQELIRREFVVDAPIGAAWRHLAKVEQWPSWAKHIRRVELTPKGELSAETAGVIYLRNGVTSKFQMAEMNNRQNWLWAGKFLWLDVYYDHRFDAVDDQHTKLTWIVASDGFAVSIFGRLFAAVYNKNLDRAIPYLMAEMQQLN